MALQSPTVIPFAAPQNAVGVTPVLPFTELGAVYDALEMILSHEGAPGTTDLELLVEASYQGVKPNRDLEQRKIIKQGEEGSINIEILFPTSCKFFRITVTSDGSTVPFIWELLGRKR